MLRIVFASLIVSFAASNLDAQSMTDQELLEIMQRQQDALEDSAFGQTRGLSIVTGTADENDTQAADTATVDGDGLTSLADIKAGTVVRFEDDLEINVQINFEFDSAALRSSEQPALDQMCRVMKKAETVRAFRIIGHTDSSGSDVYNKRLSQLRAEEVGRHLINTCGIAASRLEMIGYGEEYLDNTNDPRAPENRRVEFQALS
jgi:outer membrane protein OmpA-like peptidoglycan-associated protein